MREVILGLCVAAGLNHVVHVARVEGLDKVGGKGEVGGRPEYLLDPRRRLVLPGRSGNEVITRLVACGAAANVSVVEGVAVVEHHRVVAVLVDRRHRQHDRLGAGSGGMTGEADPVRWVR